MIGLRIRGQQRKECSAQCSRALIMLLLYVVSVEFLSLVNSVADVMRLFVIHIRRKCVWG